MADTSQDYRQRGLVPRETPLDRETALAFARRLRDRREAVDLTQEKAAEAAGMSRNHYQLLESGLSDRAKKSPANPRLSTLLDLATALRCEVAELVEGLQAKRDGAQERARTVVVTATPAHARVRPPVEQGLSGRPVSARAPGP